MAQACDRIVHGLRQAGVQIDVVHLDSRLRRWHIQRQVNGFYLSCPLSSDPAHTLQRVWLLLSAHTRAYPPTHLVAFGGQLTLLAAPVYAAWLQIPLVTLLRGNDFDLGVFNAQRRPQLFFALERSAQVCVVSQAQQQQLKHVLPQLEPTCIPNGIDLAAWQPLPSQQQWAHHWRTSYAASRPVLGLFGHLKAKKGIEFLLHTLYTAGLASKVQLLIGGSLEQAIFARLAQYPAFKVWYEPFLPTHDLMARYLACDFVALPSLYDGLPNVLLEVGVLGIPVLASRAGGIPDVVPAPECLFTPAQREECIQALQFMLNADQSTLHALGQKLYQNIAAHFTQTQETARYLELLQATQQLFIDDHPDPDSYAAESISTWQHPKT